LIRPDLTLRCPQDDDHTPERDGSRGDTARHGAFNITIPFVCACRRRPPGDAAGARVTLPTASTTVRSPGPGHEQPKPRVTPSRMAPWGEVGKIRSVRIGAAREWATRLQAREEAGSRHMSACSKNAMVCP